MKNEDKKKYNLILNIYYRLIIFNIDNKFKVGEGGSKIFLSNYFYF